MLRFLLLNVTAIGLGAVVATSCIGVNYPVVAFRCSPRQQQNCPESHFCCSDDPAAEMGALPDFTGTGVEGRSTPYFSGPNNNLGTSGMCVDTGQIPAGSGVPGTNCPIPCNPTWDETSINAVCGNARTCCQTVALEPEDCVLDGDTYRPATGADIGNQTRWAPGDHMTHQDPNGQGCQAIAQNDTSSPVYLDCVAQLTVADQRGFCMQLQPGQICPTRQPDFVDACTLLTQTGGVPPM